MHAIDKGSPLETVRATFVWWTSVQPAFPRNMPDHSQCCLTFWSKGKGLLSGTQGLRRVGANMPTAEPSLTVTNYASGTPRLEIVPSGADSIANDVTGYPDPSLCGKTSGICWSVPPNTNSYTATYADVQSYINGKGGIHAAYIVADGSQTTPYTSDVTGFSWDGQTLVLAARAASLDGKYVCGVNKELRKYQLKNVGNTDAQTVLQVKTHTSKGTVWAFFASGRVAPAGGSLTVTTHFGCALRAFYKADGGLPAKNGAGALSVTINAGTGPAC